jgi:hypothetical protein
MLQIQDAEGEAVVAYCELSATQEMPYPRLSLWVNNMAVFIFFWKSPGVKSTKVGNKAENAYWYCFLTLFAMLFMQLWGKG